MNKKYKLIPYIIYNGKNLTVIQNERTTCVLNDENLIDFFNYYDSCYDLSFTLEELKKKYNTKANSCLKYLLENSLAVELKEKNIIGVNKIKFFIDSEEIIESLKFNFCGINKTYSINFIDSKNINLSIFNDLNVDDIAYIILSSFNFSTYTKLANKLRKSNIIHKFVFYYNYSFYFTNYFKYEWHNPCPLCFFCHLEGSLRAESKLNKKISFQTLIDLIYTKTSHFNTEIVLDKYKILKLIFEVAKDLEKLSDYNIKLVKQLNVVNFNVDYDIATHWEVCVCHE